MRVAVFALTPLAETRASGSGKRFVRLQSYVMSLARALQQRGKFESILSEAFISDLFQAVPMYDIGKIGIPDRILLKPDSLTPEEFEVIKLPLRSRVKPLSLPKRRWSIKRQRCKR